MTVLPHYNDAIRNLEASRYPKQARKLIFAACRRRWENDESKLNTVTLIDLVGELLQAHPTLAELRGTLTRIVEKLNKRELYADVADEVLAALKVLYGEDTVDDDTLESVATLTLPDGTEIGETQISALGAAARILEAHPQARRMRKLLYATCYNFWENDPDKLLALDFQVLIEQAHQTYPTYAQLQNRLQRVVRSLNKRDRYEQIASVILEQLGHFYDSDLNALGSILPAGGRARALQPILESDSAIPASSPADGKPSMQAEIAAEEPKLEKTRQESSPFYNVFKLRREVMKYTTPLQAKALVFATLQGKPIAPQGVDWLLLKTYNLDDLLRDLIQAHQSLDRVVASLEEAARQQERVDEALQAASAIAISVKPIYGRTQQNL
ncbi:MAG: hypothetical protein AAFY11_00615 [Cyanobacteria bacterium J06641_5]